MNKTAKKRVYGRYTAPKRPLALHAECSSAASLLALAHRRRGAALVPGATATGTGSRSSSGGTVSRNSHARRSYMRPGASSAKPASSRRRRTYREQWARRTPRFTAPSRKSGRRAAGTRACSARPTPRTCRASSCASSLASRRPPGDYFLPRAVHEPPPALQKQLWPWIEEWESRFEERARAGAAGRTAGLDENDPAADGFLRAHAAPAHGSLAGPRRPRAALPGAAVLHPPPFRGPEWDEFAPLVRAGATGSENGPQDPSPAACATESSAASSRAHVKLSCIACSGSQTSL